ncbi:enoyl-CoA hydratase-related protein [Streptomyces sp. NPDC048629]|uniref:enoyl-CoA hydratase-related protein n=1 Tax=Streptomyces sp. NPDC048629 TaxID=3154824 RepID=UPI00343341A5
MTTAPNILVTYETDAGRATLTLNSPRNRNALSRQLVSDLFSGLERAEEDPHVRVVVLRANGSVFCSGADLSEASEGAMEEGAHALVRLQKRLLTFPKPVVARVHGAVRAGGIGIVAASDIAICTEDTTYAFTEVRLALTPAVISLTVLPRLTSRAAYRTFLTAETFDGRTAAAIGLVTQAVSDADLDATIDAVGADLLKGHPQGVRETKALLGHDILRRIEDQGTELAELSARLFGSPDAKEAMRSFLGTPT